MDVISQHLDVHDADWLTFGNVNLELWLCECFGSVASTSGEQSSLLKEKLEEKIPLIPVHSQYNQVAVRMENNFFSFFPFRMLQTIAKN